MKMKMRIMIKGPKVHDVGYRPFLIALADEFELDGIGVRNIEIEGNQAVRIKIEGDEDGVRDFEDAVKTRRPEGANVSSVMGEPYDGRVPSIERTAITNMNLQLAKGISALGRVDTTLTSMNATLTRMDTALTGVDKKMGQILGKQDETIEVLSGMDEKMDRMLVRQDETTEAIKDLQPVSGRINRIEQDIKEIKTKIGAR